MRRALSWMAAVVATTWTFHGSPAHVAPFQFLAAWSAKDAYIGGEGYAMTSAHVLRQAVHWPHIRQCLPWHTQLLHQGWTLLGHIMFCNGFVFVFQFVFVNGSLNTSRCWALLALTRWANACSGPQASINLFHCSHMAGSHKSLAKTVQALKLHHQLLREGKR